MTRRVGILALALAVLLVPAEAQGKTKKIPVKIVFTDYTNEAGASATLESDVAKCVKNKTVNFEAESGANADYITDVDGNLVITPDELRAYLRLDGDEEAAIIAGLIAAARAHVEQATGMVLDDDATVPGPLRQAMLMLIGHWFNAREAAGACAAGATPAKQSAIICLVVRYRASCT